MGDIIDCVQKKCQLEPDTDIEDIDDEDKIEPVTDIKELNTHALFKEDGKELDIQEQNKNLNVHYIENSVQDLNILGEQFSMRDYEMQDKKFINDLG